jgi:hypothetical protein
MVAWTESTSDTSALELEKLDLKVATGNFVGFPPYGDSYLYPSLPAISYLTPSLSLYGVKGGSALYTTAAEYYPTAVTVAVADGKYPTSVATGGLYGSILAEPRTTLLERSGKVYHFYQHDVKCIFRNWLFDV